ncbi:hypothetical protein RHA1_ro08537 (plasmid) [Rhodococcus jostii RHA1]|uniref:Uncharacterized protein n=1 Tax=Rhodococcus jostii (strain RHA1) TaxID=101510 RepID=Q0RYQ5_RHOJR|nr:hypothetical protein RHA1_ro08537 [Rhodococcus jostii RHA1]
MARTDHRWRPRCSTCRAIRTGDRVDSRATPCASPDTHHAFDGVPGEHLVQQSSRKRIKSRLGSEGNRSHLGTEVAQRSYPSSRMSSTMSMRHPVHPVYRMKSTAEGMYDAVPPISAAVRSLPRTQPCVSRATRST